MSDGREAFSAAGASAWRGRAVAALLFVGVLGVAISAGLVAGSGSMLGLQLIGLVIATVIGLRHPWVLLTVGLATSLGGGQYAYLARLGGEILIVGGLISSVRLLLRPIKFPVVLILVSLVCGYIGVRFLISGEYEAVKALARCLGAVALAYGVMQRGRQECTKALALAGILFVFLNGSVLFFDPNPYREIGIVGNPNRMMFGVLTLLPFGVEFLRQKRPPLWKVMVLALTASAVLLGIRSGSTQVVVGFAALIAYCVLIWQFRAHQFARVFMISTVGALALAFGSTVLTYVAQDGDLVSLSGRTGMHEAAARTIAQNPFFGSGTVHVSDGLLRSFSAHSSVLGITASTGIIIGIAWIGFLLLSLRRGWQFARIGNFSGAAAYTLVLIQFVQSIELLPLSWVLILYFLNTPEEVDLQDVIHSEPPHFTDVR